MQTRSAIVVIILTAKQVTIISNPVIMTQVSKDLLMRMI